MPSYDLDDADRLYHASNEKISPRKAYHSVNEDGSIWHETKSVALAPDGDRTSALAKENAIQAFQLASPGWAELGDQLYAGGEDRKSVV